MKCGARHVWKTAACFLAGLAGAWLWPSPDSGSSGGSRRTTANAPSIAPRAEAAEPHAGLAGQLAAHRRARALTTAQARDLLMQLSPPVPEDDEAWWEELIKRWAEEEPEAAVAWVQKASRKGVSDELLYAALKPLARKDLSAALTAARRCVRSMPEARAELPAAAAERDPRGTMDLLEKEPRFLAQFGAKAMAVWLRSDPATAWAWLNASPARSSLLAAVAPDIMDTVPDRIPSLLASLPENSDARRRMMRMMAGEEVQRDPVTAIEKFKSLGTRTREREDLLSPVLTHTALYADPAEISGLLAALDKHERWNAIHNLADGLSEAGPDRLFSVLQTEGFSAQERSRIMARCTALGPEYAQQFMDAAKTSVNGEVKDYWLFNLRERPAESLPVFKQMVESGEVNSGVLLSLIQSMHPADSERWIEVLPEEKQQAPRAYLTLSRAMSDPATDLTPLSMLPDAKTVNAVLSEFFEHTSGHEQARDIIARLPAGLQLAAINSFSFRENDGKALAPVIEKALATPPADTTAATLALYNVIRSMPAANGEALQWLDTLPSGPSVSATRPAAFGAWASQDEVAAAAWLQTRPDIPQRDEMVQQLVYNLSSHDPESAWKWALSASDNRRRESLKEAVLTQWRTLDPVAAAAFEPGNPP
jgi:hypothetical protein